MSFVKRAFIALTTIATLAVPMVATAPADAAGTVRSAVSLTGPSIGTYGSTVALTGTAWRYGTSTKLVRATVWLERRLMYGSVPTWSRVVSTQTDSNGRFSFSVVLGTRYSYRAHYGGSPTYTANVSAIHDIAIQHRLIARYLKDVNWELGTLEGKVSVYPRPPAGTRIWLQRLGTDGLWHDYISGRAVSGSNDVVIRGNVNGSVGKYRFYAPIVSPYSQGNSSTLTFAHYKWRGVFHRAVLGTGGTGNPQVDVAPATDDPYRSYAEAVADVGGTVWADLNTAGCAAIEGFTGTDTAGQTRVSLLNGTTIGRSVVVTAADSEDGRPLSSWYMSGLPKVRVQVSNTGSTTDTFAWLALRVRCAN